MLRLLIARHGQSEWNAAGRWQGQADAPLSELGERQAEKAATVLGSFDAVVASDLDRAARTAAIIANAIGIGPVLVDPALRERHAGPWQGLTRPEIEARYPGDIEAERWPEGWEYDEDLVARVVPAVHRIAEEVPIGEVLVVSHGGVIYALERGLGLPFERIRNLGARWFMLENGVLSAGERVDLVPDSTLSDGL